MGSKFLPNGYLIPGRVMVFQQEREIVHSVKQHYRAEQGIQTLLGHRNTEVYTNKKQQAERRRHNEQLACHIRQYRQKRQALSEFTPPLLLPPTHEELVRKRPLHQSHYETTQLRLGRVSPITDSDESGNE
ncbi:hypothetical protein LTR17_021028 [Elasticomyces elasticus]|nr:hypothetical protein LTR17_021028 [Elasticomyces elasticus]